MQDPLIQEQADVTSVLGEPQLHHQIMSMLKDIHFTDIPIILLFLFLITWAFLIFYYRKNMIVSSVLFTITCFLIGSTQILDDLVQKYWNSLHFTTNFLGSSTYVFMFTFWALPLLIISVIFLSLLIFDILKLNWDSSFVAAIKKLFHTKKDAKNE
ncbi:hypothetical protein TRFO_04338 [Tritrichomonas foetus]|uniref:Uncharacterized protein n=1 Tax=Tritrichomonas foetus TaxID=1144522 RepID=A0A1J4KGF9_9EUKA|nr:hypothetical protein TRFO_04338 [Tritrichomonas foetus]|eukprot:OHT10299.1 hypothetical protein TRFO_04338 [Tritrichomonas foetus]